MLPTMKIMMMIALWAVYILTVGTHAPASGKQVKQLFRDLLTGYDVKLRPVRNQDNPVLVGTRFHIQEVMVFSEIKRTITVRGWFDVSWTDEYLVWNASDYGDTDRLVIPRDSVWIPQIALNNGAAQTAALGQDPDSSSLFAASVYSNGSILWQPGNAFEAFCDVQIRQYPFDIQTCKLMFIVWNYPINDVRIVPKDQPHTLAFFTPNPEWNVTTVETTSMISPANYSKFVISVRMFRRPRFILTTMIAPLVMIAFLNPCVFLLPAKSGEKTSFILTLFLAFSVYMTVISGTLPPTADEESLFASYIVTVLAMCVIMTFWSVMDVRVSNLRCAGCVPQCVYRSWHLLTAKYPKKTDFSRRREDSRDAYQMESADGNEANDATIDMTQIQVEMVDGDRGPATVNNKILQCMRDWKAFFFFTAAIVLIHIVFFGLMLSNN
jgi:hypothetical protein